MACQGDYTEEDLKLMQSVADEILNELKELPRYIQVDERKGFIFTYNDYLKLKRKFRFTKKNQR